MKNQRNYTEMKNVTAVKAQARIDVMKVIAAALINEFGEDAVKKVGNNEYGVIVGTANDNDGCPNDVVTTVKPTVKEWETRKATKKTFEKYDLEEAHEMYLMELDEKEKKKEQKAAEKAAKIARDKAAREKKKAEKENETTED